MRQRASQINGCAFCIDRHANGARKAGEIERRLTLVCVWRATSLCSERERAAPGWAGSVTRGLPGSLTGGSRRR